jgi:hypothetical protein
MTLGEFGSQCVLVRVAVTRPSPSSRGASPRELKARTINRVRTFLKSQIPMRAAAQ